MYWYPRKIRAKEGEEGKIVGTMNNNGWE